MNRDHGSTLLSALACAAVGCGGGSGAGGAAGGGGDAGGAGPSLLLVAAVSEGSAQPSLGFSYDVTTDTWSTGTALGTGTGGAIDGQHGAVSLAFSGADGALAVLTNATDTSGVSGPVQFATWSTGRWAPFAAVGSGVEASSAPSLAVGAPSAELAFSGDGTSVESMASYADAKWSGAAAVEAFAGGPPSVAARGADATLAYARLSDGALVSVDRTGGTWGAEVVIVPGSAPAPATPSFAPSLVALTGAGPELVVVYTDVNLADLHFATRTGGRWSAVQDFGLPKKVVNPDPASDGTDQPSPSFATPVVALPGGGAALAFTSASQHVYTSRFDGASWSTATSVFTPWCLDCLDAAQVGLAPGVGGATIEVVLGGDPSSSNQYVPYHTRLVAGHWTSPKPVLTTAGAVFAAYAMASR
jgi:hypothetical protein